MSRYVLLKVEFVRITARPSVKFHKSHFSKNNSRNIRVPNVQRVAALMVITIKIVSVYNTSEKGGWAI